MFILFLGYIFVNKFLKNAYTVTKAVIQLKLNCANKHYSFVNLISRSANGDSSACLWCCHLLEYVPNESKLNCFVLSFQKFIYIIIFCHQQMLILKIFPKNIKYILQPLNYTNQD